MPLQRTHEGGALMLIDAANYSEQNTPANAGVPAIGGQSAGDRAGAQHRPRRLALRPHHARPIRCGTAPTACWSSYRPCEVTQERRGRLVRDADRRRDGAPRRRRTASIADDRRPTRCRTTCRRRTPIYMFDPAQQTLLIVAAPPAGFMYIDPVAHPAAHRAERDRRRPRSTRRSRRRTWACSTCAASTTPTAWAAWATRMLTAADLPAGCTHRDREDDADRPDDTRAPGRRHRAA